MAAAMRQRFVRSLRVIRQRMSFASAEQEEAPSVLRHSVVGGVQNLVIFPHSIAALTELLDDLFEKARMPSNRQAANVLEDKIRSPKFHHQTDKVMHQRVARIVQGSLADHTETLARRPAEYDVHIAVADPGIPANVAAVDIGHASADGSAVRKVELVRGAVDRVVLDGRRDIEAGLLEPQAHPACACEQIYTDWPSVVCHCDSFYTASACRSQGTLTAKKLIYDSRRNVSTDQCLVSNVLGGAILSECGDAPAGDRFLGIGRERRRGEPRTYAYSRWNHCRQERRCRSRGLYR